MAGSDAHNSQSDDESDDDESDDDDAAPPFFGPFSGPSLKERRAAWERLLGPGVERRAGCRNGRHGRKKRKVETRARHGRYEHEFVEGVEQRWRLDPNKSVWWELLNHPEVADENSAAGRRFRSKFRLPYAMAMQLVADAQKVDEWKDKPSGPGNGRGPGRHPLVLKVLATLRHLGKGLDPETLEEGAQISKSLLKVFIPAFVKWMAETLYPREVRLPTGTHLERSMRVYETLGFPGAYCSADGVHVEWDRAPAATRADYVGKEGYPTVAFVVGVLHSREVIHVSTPMPGKRNDKTQAQHAELFHMLRYRQLRWMGSRHRTRTGLVRSRSAAVKKRNQEGGEPTTV